MRTISRRLVFLFPGFEPLSASYHAERFRRGAAKTAATWGVEVSSTSPAVDAPGEFVVTLSDAGWSTETEIVICDWSSLILGYARRPALVRITDGMRALLDFALSGTFFRYCRVSWRYALFFLYPIVLLALVLIIGALVAFLPLSQAWPTLHLFWSLPLASIVVAGLLAFAGRRLHLLTLMDDWAFARDFVRAEDEAVVAHMRTHREMMVERMAAREVDEILVVGHSLGASHAALALDAALKTSRPRAPVHVLTVGSSLLKTALHPAARAQREAVRSIVALHRLRWVDVQAVSDVLNFYRSNPARSLGIHEGQEPIVSRISLGKSVGPRTRRLNSRSFFRRHRQFVYGSEKRQAFSLHMILLGPVSFERYATRLDVDLAPLAGKDRKACREAARP